MSGGKYLEEARKSRKLDHFCNEHPSKADRARFIALLNGDCLSVVLARSSVVSGQQLVGPGIYPARQSAFLNRHSPDSSGSFANLPRFRVFRQSCAVGAGCRWGMERAGAMPSSENCRIFRH
jgi:hypothetical protein